MPGPFTHIYTERRLADFFTQDATAGGVNASFVRDVDGNLISGLDPGMLHGLTPAEAARLMQDWPKFAALGAIGPDFFFFLQDYANPAIPCDEIMFALSLLYWLDDEGRIDEWEGLLAIIADITGKFGLTQAQEIKFEHAFDLPMTTASTAMQFRMAAGDRWLSDARAFVPPVPHPKPERRLAAPVRERVPPSPCRA